MIATLAEIKAILGISGTGSDTQITALMPNVQRFIIDYCNNDFSNSLYHNSITVTFTASSSKIEDLEGDVSDLEGSTNISVDGSYFNNNNYTVSTLADTEIVVDETLIDEDNGRSIVIRTVVYPESLKNTYASMINTKIIIGGSVGIKSKKLETFSVEYSTSNMAGGYLKSDLQSLNEYRKMRKA